MARPEELHTLHAQCVVIPSPLLRWLQRELMPGVPINIKAWPKSQKSSGWLWDALSLPLDASRVPNWPFHSVAAPALDCTTPLIQQMGSEQETGMWHQTFGAGRRGVQTFADQQTGA